MKNFIVADPFQSLIELSKYSISEIERFCYDNEEELASDHWEQYLSYRKGETPKDYLIVPILYVDAHSENNALGYLVAPNQHDDESPKQKLPSNILVKARQEIDDLLPVIKKKLNLTDMPNKPNFQIPHNGHGESFGLSLFIYFIHKVFALKLPPTWYFTGVYKEDGFISAEELAKKCDLCIQHGAKKMFLIEGHQANLKPWQKKLELIELPKEPQALILRYLQELVTAKIDPNAITTYLYQLKVNKEKKIPKNIEKYLNNEPIINYYINMIRAKNLLHEGYTQQAAKHFEKCKSFTFQNLPNLSFHNPITYDLAIHEEAQEIILNIDLGYFTFEKNQTPIDIKRHIKNQKKIQNYFNTFPNLPLGWELFCFNNSLARLYQYNGRWNLDKTMLKKALKLITALEKYWTEIILYGRNISRYNTFDRHINQITDIQFDLKIMGVSSHLLTLQKRELKLTDPYNILAKLQMKYILDEELSDKEAKELLENSIALFPNFSEEHHIFIRIIYLLQFFNCGTKPLELLAKKSLKNLYSKNGIDYLTIPRACNVLKLPFPKLNKNHYLAKQYQQLLKTPDNIIFRTPY